MTDRQRQLYKIAFGLAIATTAIAMTEGLVSTYFGCEGGSWTLLGFGADSFIEVFSGIGIAHMVMRIGQNAYNNRVNFERTALRITGLGFYALVIGLVLTSIYNIWTGHKPETALSGVFISLFSMGAMWALIYGKTRVGKELQSDAILADAECTRVCIYMSVVLLAASGIYELTRIAYIDSIGTLGLAYFSLKEGRECFQKVKSGGYCSGDHDKQRTR